MLIKGFIRSWKNLEKSVLKILSKSRRTQWGLDCRGNVHVAVFMASCCLQSAHLFIYLFIFYICLLIFHSQTTHNIFQDPAQLTDTNICTGNRLRHYIMFWKNKHDHSSKNSWNIESDIGHERKRNTSSVERSVRTVPDSEWWQSNQIRLFNL